MIKGYWINRTTEEAERKIVIEKIQEKYSGQREMDQVYRFEEGIVSINKNWKNLLFFVNPNEYETNELSDKEESVLVGKITSLGFECKPLLDGERVIKIRRPRRIIR
jgi:hypothetical protein